MSWLSEHTIQDTAENADPPKTPAAVCSVPKHTSDGNRQLLLFVCKEGAKKQMTKAQGSLGNILNFLSSCTQRTSLCHESSVTNITWGNVETRIAVPLKTARSLLAMSEWMSLTMATEDLKNPAWPQILPVVCTPRTALKGPNGDTAWGSGPGERTSTH